MEEENKNGYTIIDKRYQEKPKEVCRVCGSYEVHTQNYNHPTMKCIEYLRNEIILLKEKVYAHIV